MGASQVRRLCPGQSEKLDTERQLDSAMRNFKRLTDARMSKLQSQNARMTNLRNTDDGEVDDLKQEISSL